MKHKKNVKHRKYISLMATIMLFVFVLESCNFISQMSGDSPATSAAKINSLRFIRSELSIKAGEIQMLQISVSPSSEQKNVIPRYTYDQNLIKIQTNTQGVIITGLKEGVTPIMASYGGHEAICMIRVSGYTEDYEREPYIYSSFQIVQMSPGQSNQVHVSLYGGTAADMNGWAWQIEDNNSVVSLEQNGQYATLVANNNGYTRIKITHQKAAYPYYMGVYVFPDLEKATYLTTKENIITLYKNSGKKNISVNLINPTNDSWKVSDKFAWEILPTENVEELFSIVANGQNAEITPVKTGQGTIRVKHEQSSFPLDIIVQVVEIVENVYIEPSETTTILTGTQEKTLSFKLVNLKEGSQYSPDEFTYEIENEDVLEHYSSSNQLTVSGKKNGSSQVIIRHPSAKRARQILVIINEHPNDAINSDVYITTSQNYVKTKIGADDTSVSIILKNGKQGDETKFTWTVSHLADDGTKDNVIDVRTTTGYVAQASARAATYTSAVGNAIITPRKEGTATITISHPKSLYTTEILVKVLGVNAILDNPLSIDGSGIIKFLNSETYNASVSLYGNAKTSDNAKIKWTTEARHLQLQANENKAVVSSTGRGQLTGQIVVTHPNAVNPKNILVLSADNEEDLENMKAFYADKTYWSVNEGEQFRMPISQVGWYGTIDPEDGTYTQESFTGIKWTSDRPDIAYPIVDNQYQPLAPMVTALKAGVAKIKVSYQGVSAEFTVTVYPRGTQIDAIEQTRYLTTSSNVVNLAPNSQKTVNITMIGINESEASKMQWGYQGDVVEVKPNGKTAVIIAKKNGEGEITVTHPKSENTLKIHVRVGEEFVGTDANVCYIRANQDVFTMVKGAQAQQLSVSLINGSQAESGFSFSIDDTDIASITGYATGRCFIAPKQAGMAEITVSHPEAVADKKILVVVGNTEEELKGFKYLSTSTNVINIAEGSTRNVSVSLNNTDEIAVTGFTWRTEDIRTAGINETSASTAVISGNKIGTTKITVTHESCKYPLEIIVQVVDPNTMAKTPYVFSTTNVMVLQTNDVGYKTVTAELVGGTKEDQRNLIWESSNPKLLSVIGNNGEARIKALDVGTAYVTVSHPKTTFSSQILVICERGSVSECYLSIPESVITMRPTDKNKSITVTLNGGTTSDRTGFKWSLDVYDVIDITHTGTGTAIISPKQQGNVQITVSHPKAASDLIIIVKVTEYTTFGFGTNSKTIAKGVTTFQNMQIPASNIKTHVEYHSSSDKVVAVSGTSAVCQLVALEEGTSTVTARLIDTNTNKVQATHEMLVYVSPGSSNLTYITTSNNIVTIEKNSNKTLQASLIGTGITNLDQQNLTWQSDNPDIVELRGASSTGKATGPQAMFTAKKAGETTITVSHDKSATNLVIYVIVPGDAELNITLNSSYREVEKNKSIELKASIAGGKTQDYNNIIWSADRVNYQEIVRVMGSGQTVTIYGINSGVTTVYAQLPNGNKAQCQVQVATPVSLSFDTGSFRLTPNEEKELKYKVSPTTAHITWRLSEGQSVNYTDLGVSGEAGEGTLLITGIKETRIPVQLIGVTEHGAQAQIQITCSWDYNLTVNKTKLSGKPDKQYEIAFSVYPPDMTVTYEAFHGNDIEILKDDKTGHGKLIVTPRLANSENIIISMQNPANGEVPPNTKTVATNFRFDALTPTIKLTSNGTFSKKVYNSSVVVGDGEEIAIEVGVEEKGVDFTVTNIRFSQQKSDWTQLNHSSKVIRFKNNTDVATIEYLFEKYYGLVSNGTETTRKGYWYARHICSKCESIPSNCYNSPGNSCGLLGAFTGTKTHIPEKDGYRISQKEYQSIHWYYRPRNLAAPHSAQDHPHIGWANKFTCSGITSAADTGNQPYKAVPVLDTTLVKTEPANLIITYTIEGTGLNKGFTQDCEIEVTLETRNCAYNCGLNEEDDYIRKFGSYYYTGRTINDLSD